MRKSKIITALVVVVIFIWNIPILWMFFASIKPTTEPINDMLGWFVAPFTLENYIYVLTSKNANILQWLLNSIIVATLGTIMSVAIASIAAYGFAFYKFPFKKAIFVFFMLGIIMPKEILLMPLYILINNLGIFNHYSSLILPSVASSMTLLILANYFNSLPKSIFEAATIDGASSFQLFFKFIIPLSKPALSAVAIMIFITYWNDFLWPYICITEPEMMTIPVGIQLFKSKNMYQMSIPLAANILSLIPVVLVYSVVQKSIIRSFTLHSSKY